MLRLRSTLWRLLILTLLLLPVPLHAAEPVVRAVMFHSPECPHCHEVIENVLPPLAEQYGEQFDIRLINVDTEGGGELFWTAIDAFSIPEDQVGVPLMVIGETYMVGEDEVRSRLPGILEQGIARGGIDWPAIPGLRSALAELPDEQPSTCAAMPVGERLARDPIGNTVALAVLVLLIASVLLVANSWRQHGFPMPVQAAGWRGWAVPVLALLGLAVALYLAYVEVTQSDAFCGPVGDCNVVQQSPFARLFGVLPIGVLGAVGYVVVLVLWAWQRNAPAQQVRRNNWMMPAVVLSGTLFSIYLTYLEPFVICAVCMWCVSSAVIMMLLLWTSRGSPAGPARRGKRARQRG